MPILSISLVRHSGEEPTKVTHRLAVARGAKMQGEQSQKPCNDSCNDRYGVLDIPWRVYCKKACNSDGEAWDDCVEDCKSMCHKYPVIKELEWSSHFDRSPGSPTKSRKCQKACIRGCAFKFNVTAADVALVLPRKPSPPPKDNKQPVVAPVHTTDEPSISA